MMMFDQEEPGFGGFGQLAPQLAQPRPQAPQFSEVGGGGGGNPSFLGRIRDLVSGNMRQTSGMGGQAQRWQPDFRQAASRMAGPRRMPRQRFNEGQGQGY